MRFSKDHAQRSISVGPTLGNTTNENANRTPLNPGTTTGPGDEFLYVPEAGPGYEYPVNVAWDYSFTGGTFTALVVIIEFSDDGVNWFQVDTSSATSATRKVITNQVPRFMRANVTTFTVATGSPVLTVGLTC